MLTNFEHEQVEEIKDEMAMIRETILPSWGDRFLRVESDINTLMDRTKLFVPRGEEDDCLQAAITRINNRLEKHASEISKLKART